MSEQSEFFEKKFLSKSFLILLFLFDFSFLFRFHIDDCLASVFSAIRACRMPCRRHIAIRTFRKRNAFECVVRARRSSLGSVMSHPVNHSFRSIAYLLKKEKARKIAFAKFQALFVCLIFTPVRFPVILEDNISREYGECICRTPLLLSWISWKAPPS